MDRELVTLHVPFLTTAEMADVVRSALGALPAVQEVCYDVERRTVTVRCDGAGVSDRALLVAVYRVAPASCSLEPVTLLGRAPVAVGG
ncbi:MAG: heavy-metal-associated domain-containing protein [Chloroflexi bacterium]|nr:heavy-metal-associated domain-containing protein [Chloroflexota bacterium]